MTIPATAEAGTSRNHFLPSTADYYQLHVLQGPADQSAVMPMPSRLVLVVQDNGMELSADGLKGNCAYLVGCGLMCLFEQGI
jgi:hypothetical protein